MEKSLPKINTPKGFTLVELMVVIAIIAILAAVGITIFNGQQINARDARRRSDIDSIANAMEAAKGQSTTYVALADSQFAGGKVPADPSKTYCIATTTTSTATLLADPSSWTTTTCAITTPGAGQTAWTTPATGVPAAGSYLWRVCASMESSSASPVVYCRSNAQ